MLILMRRTKERLRIGDDIIVEVCGVNSYQVKIGIIAPKAIRIDRAEVAERRKVQGPKKK